SNGTRHSRRPATRPASSATMPSPTTWPRPTWQRSSSSTESPKCGACEDSRTMKLHFEPDLDYQLQAIEAVCDLFRGQEICRTECTVARDPGDAQMRLGFAQNDLGIGNRLTLLDDELMKNLNDIQIRNGLAPAETLVSGDFTVEMETGTGKTYVYLRTIFELNRRFGFTK